MDSPMGSAVATSSSSARTGSVTSDTRMSPINGRPCGMPSVRLSAYASAWNRFFPDHANVTTAMTPQMLRALTSW